MKRIVCPYYSNSINQPSRIGWITETNEFTYSKINELVCRYQVYLENVGLEKNGTIAIESENTPRLLGLLFAAQRNGIRTVILGAFSTPESRQNAIDRSQARLISLDEAEACIKAEPLENTDNLNYELDFDDISVILFTSGSTGREKGVCLSVGNLFNSAEASNECTQLDLTSNWLLSLTFARIGGLAIVYRCALASASITFSRSLSGNDLLKTIVDNRITHASLVPVQLEELTIDSGSIDELLKLKAILLGGAPASKNLLDAIVKLQLPVLTTYGMTETTSHISLASLNDPVERVYTSGKILKHSKVKLISMEDGKDLSINDKKGLLLVSGSTVTPGYVDECGSEKFSEDGWYATGDIAYIDIKGQLNIVGRADDMIISGGENIHLHEIEVAAENIDGITSAAAIGVKHQKWGQRPLLFVVAPKIELNFIFQHLKAKLNKIKVPDRIIYLDEMPRISIGKIDYQHLKKMIEDEYED